MPARLWLPGAEVMLAAAFTLAALMVHPAPCHIHPILNQRLSTIVTVQGTSTPAFIDTGEGGGVTLPDSLMSAFTPIGVQNAGGYWGAMKTYSVPAYVITVDGITPTSSTPILVRGYAKGKGIGAALVGPAWLQEVGGFSLVGSSWKVCKP